MPERTRTWSVPTSPRSPYKLPFELRLLQSLVGHSWSRATQRAFAESLRTSEDFEGHVYDKQPDWSARDRINRAPLTLGLVRLTPTIIITPAGQQLLDEKQAEEVMLKQLLKWQYPSPKHGDRYYRERFCIRPFLETLRLVRECDGLTKEEVALFAIPLVKYGDSQKTHRTITKYRAQLARLRGIARKQFRRDFILTTFGAIYRDDIRTGRIRTRQSLTSTAQQFVTKKYRNARDYADAAIRYFRFTGLFTLKAASNRLAIRRHRLAFVDRLLEDFPREPDDYQASPEQFLQRFGDPRYPKFPSDQSDILRSEIQSLKDTLHHAGVLQEKVATLEGRYEGTELRKALEREVGGYHREAMKAELRSGRLREEIVRSLATITARSINDVVWDKSLLFEWNLWRAFEMLDRGDVKPHLLLDNECQPLDHAPGGLSDLEAHYDQFVLVVEATLRVGERQFDAEGEPIFRHYGGVAQRLQNVGDPRPIYGIFIAPRISNAMVAHCFALRKTHVSHYGGKAKFVPLSISEFNRLLMASARSGCVNLACVLDALRSIDHAAEIANDEQGWINHIQQLIHGL